MQTVEQTNMDWLYKLKKKVLLVLIGILAVSILVSALLLNNALVNDSHERTRELSLSIRSSLKSLMLHGDPNMIQDTLEEIGSVRESLSIRSSLNSIMLTGDPGIAKDALEETENGKESILEIMILDREGKIVHSSNRSDIGRVLDRYTDENCRICHMRRDTEPYENRDVFIEKDNTRIQRSVNVLFNEKECYECHDKSNRINGKLIIDRSMSGTYALIFSIETFMLVFGVVLIFFIYIFLARSFDRYIIEIFRRHSEVTLLYSLVERLSKSIDIEELKYLIIEIFRDSLDADEVVIILPKEGMVYRAMLWSSSTNIFTRVKIDEFDPISVAVIDWFEGTLKEDLVSQDRKEVYLPLEKGGNKLAMIVIKKLDRSFDEMKLLHVKAISSHLSVAFDNARLYSLAITDELTGLYTRRHLRHIITREFDKFKERGEKITIKMLDLDDFKKVNVTYGHIVGDNVLKGLGRCIRDSVKQNDIAFRYGGEEFAVLLPATDIKGGLFVAERIRKAVEGYVFEEDGCKIRLTVSVGVSTCPGNAVTIHQLIITADKALYEAKRMGKNRVVASDSKVS